MEHAENSLPVIDLHCDLLSYLADEGGADAFNKSDIGCAIPCLADGNVKIQVAAIYSSVFQGSSDAAPRQAHCLQKLLQDQPNLLSAVSSPAGARSIIDSDRIGLVLSIENASAFCEEDEPLDQGFARLDKILQTAERMMYISLTHFGENRFGGGNTTDGGLKKDGMSLLDHLNERNIAVDLSHASDALAMGILDYIDKRGLTIPVMASHSNFRAIWDHSRNLPDEVAKEIIRRKGVIGICFLRDILHREDRLALRRHIEHGLELGARDALCFGSDYFCIKSHPDTSRMPFFFEEHEDAGRFPSILRSLNDLLDKDGLIALAYRNALEFLERIWRISPYDRGVWWAENLPIMILVIVLVIIHFYQKFSALSYFLMACLVILHTIGGHYTFERVPFGFVTDLFGFERNHYDRVAHFSVGFYAFPIAELLLRRKLVTSRWILFLFPIFTIFTVAGIYEIFEWLYALSAESDKGTAV
ncbi:MAG: DUF2238 domain-containing protein, partial [Planctomycetota bacterium]